MNAAVFRQYDRAALDREYDNVIKISPDTLKAHRVRWAEQSARARETIPCSLDVPYGPSAGERLDIFRPKRAGLAKFSAGGVMVRTQLDADIAKTFTSDSTRREGLGYMPEETSKATIDMLVSQQMISASIDVSKAFNNSFVLNSPKM